MASRATYPFEEADGLDLLPLAARRALDLAGLRLSLQGWQSLSLNDRRTIAEAGAIDQVPIVEVRAVVAQASPPPQPLEARPDPPVTSLPPTLLRMLGAEQSISLERWASLRALDRYALRHLAAPERIDRFQALIASLPPPRRPTTLASRWPDAPRTAAQAPHVSPSVPPPTEPEPIVASEPEPAPALTHLDERGEARMVDVSPKAPSQRRAVASARVLVSPQTLAQIASDGAPKGDVFGVARVAAIQAAKQTQHLIPLCHAVALTRVEVRFELDPQGGQILITASADAIDRTGVEMEAMVAASVAALTIYDMIKGIERGAVVGPVRLERKEGGKSGLWVRQEEP